MNVFGLITAYIVGLIAAYEMDLSTLYFGLFFADFSLIAATLKKDSFGLISAILK